ncbi:MAG TPA: FHA domain-containing protein [Chloroflexota bacterium]|nr:FHA domain-containing protein [Chloroflexota bacterium]
MSFDVLLFVLRVAFLLLLYVFLFAVVKVAWGSLKKTAEAREAIVPPSSLVRLRVVAGGRNGLANQAFDLWSSATLGRAPDNTIVLPDPSVSAHHAAVRQEQGQWWVEDLRSTNGTAVNESWLRGPSPLYPGDVVRLGEVLLRLEVDDIRG